MRKLMHPQPIWEEAPTLDDGKWGGRFRTCKWGWDGPEEGDDLDEHTPPSPEFRPVCDDGIMWFWTDEMTTHYIIDHSKVATPAEASAISELMLQMYAASQHGITFPLVDRAESLGVGHCFVAVDGPQDGRLVFVDMA